MIILLKFLQFCFRIIFLAPASPALFIMRTCAWLIQSIARRTKIRKTVIEDIKMVLPKNHAEQTADNLIKNTGLSLFEILCIPFFKQKHYQSVFEWKGIEHLNQALALKKGVIILTMHAGNYEATIPALSNQGFPMNVILRATDDPAFEIVNRSRSAKGAKLINILQEDTYKEALKALSNNELVYLLADTGALESRHEFRKFLGREVPVATGWLTLAQRADCAVIPTLVKREGNKNIISLYEPIKVTKENREEALQKAGKVFEDFIKENPDHWAIFLNPYETKRMANGK